MKFSYDWLQSFFIKKLPPPIKLADFLTLYSFEASSNKGVLDLDILPNRGPDCFSHIGVAREIAAVLGIKLQIPSMNIIKDKGLKDFISIEVKAKSACPRYAIRTIFGVKVGPSPKWMQERLELCGLRPINNIVDAANYVMIETGQPLHAFDAEKIAGKKIVVRFAKKGEKIITLDGQKFDLDPSILIIADNSGPIAIAGIKGGKNPEVSEKTKIVVIESANFNPKTIRAGSKKLGLKTDASLRFEHGIDPNLAELASNRLAYVIQKIANGKVSKNLIDFYPKKTFPKIIKLDLTYVNKLLGTKISEKEIRNILEKLGFQSSKIGSCLKVTVPTFRLDLSLPEDLIEEIGRIYGYENILPKLPFGSLVPAKRNLKVFWRGMIKNILKEAGFSEIYNYSFVSQKDISIFKINPLEVKNPTSSEFQYLRPSLICNLLKNVKKNNNKGIKIFELGNIFGKTEKTMLTGLISQDNAFFLLKGIIDTLLRGLAITDFYYDSYLEDIPFWNSKRSAEVKIGQKKIGFLGEISSSVLRSLDISERVAAFELDFEKLYKLCSEEHEYMPISKHPAAIRDLSILVPKKVKTVEVLNIINALGETLVRDVDLFDIYEGKEVPFEKKNFAFRIVYQAEDRTLKTDEIDKIHQKIIKILDENPEWQVRK